MKAKTKTRILSMDGGPTGLTYLDVLLKIEQRRPGFLAGVDIFVGTSFGALSALYLAKFVDSNEDGTVVIQGCIDFVQAAFDLTPKLDNWERLLVGKLPMYDNADIAAVLSSVLGAATTIGDLDRRVIIVAAGSVDPSGPVIYDSDADPSPNVCEVALESSAAPILLPLRNGRVDGGLASNSPSMEAVSLLLSASSGLSPEDLVLLSVGGDGGSSSLSNLFVPGASAGSTEARVAALQQPEGAPDEVAALYEKAAEVLEQWEGCERQLADPEYTIPRIGRPFFTEEELFDESSGNGDWGWRAWLLYLFNPVFFLQVLLNNQGLTAARQAKCLLGGQALRLAPMAILDSNQLFLLFFFFGPNGLLRASADVTASLWENPFTSVAFDFQPNSIDTFEWLERHWT